MDGKVSVYATPVAKNAEISASIEGGAKKPETPILIEGIKLPLVYNERLAEILHGFGLKASEENINILRLLYEGGFPLTKENFFKMNHALKLAGSSDKALFMFENNIKLTSANLAMLDGIVSGKAKVTKLLTDLAEAINEVKDSAIRAKLSEVFAREKEALEVLLQKSQSAKQTATSGANPVPVEKLTAQAAAHHINIAYLGKFISSNTENTKLAEISSEGSGKAEAQTSGTGKENLDEMKAAFALKLGEVKAPVVKQVNYENIGDKPQSQEVAIQTPKPVETALPQAVMDEAPVSGKNMAGNIVSNQSSVAEKPRSFSNLLFRPTESNPLEISRYIESLRSRLIEIIQTLRQSPDASSSRVVSAAREILNHIDFSSQIRSQIYVQLPYSMGDGHTDVSLFVFKDAKKSSASDGRGISSAFLSLETSSLGLFETFVQKKDNSIHLQFRLQDDETIDYVKENIARLDTLLGENDLSLASYNFTKSDEPFTVLDKPQKLNDEVSTAILAGDEIPKFDELV